MRSRIRLLVAGLTCLLLAACGGGPAAPPGTSDEPTNYFQFVSLFGFVPNAVLEAHSHLIAGDYKGARPATYGLHNNLPTADVFTPMGSLDLPTPNGQLDGTVEVAGWTFDNVGVANVEVSVDDVLAGAATYGTSRPDVPTVWPSAPVNCGYQFQLDTALYPNGPHILDVKTTDTSGNIAAFPQLAITISN